MDRASITRKLAAVAMAVAIISGTVWVPATADEITSSASQVSDESSLSSEIIGDDSGLSEAESESSSESEESTADSGQSESSAEPSQAGSSPSPTVSPSPNAVVQKSARSAVVATKDTTLYAVLNTNSGLRKLSDADSPIYKMYAKGTDVIVYKTVGNSYYVKIAGESGYVDKSAVTMGNAVTNYSVNFRVSGSTSAAIISTLSKGTRVSVVSKSGGWYKAVVNETVGYISSDYVVKDSVGTVSKVTDNIVSFNNEAKLFSSASTGSSVIGNYSIGVEAKLLKLGEAFSQITVDGKTGYVETKFLRRGNAYINSYSVLMRKSASTSSSLIKTLSIGDRVTIVGTSESWTKIVCSGISGYVYSKYVTKDPVAKSGGQQKIYSLKKASGICSAEDGNSFATLPKGTAVTLISTGTIYYKVQSGSNVGYVAKADLQEGNAKVIADSVPIKSQNSGSSGTVKTVKTGQRVTVISTGSVWSKIQCGSIIGYIENVLLEKDYTGDEDFNPSATICFIKCDSSLYYSSSTKSTVLGTYKAGTTARLLKDDGKYCRVIVNKKVGYFLKTSVLYGNAYTASSSMKLMADMTASSKSLLTVPLKARVTVLWASGDWVKIKYSGKTGYVLKYYLVMVKPGYKYEENVTQKLISSAKIYSSKSASSSVVCDCSKGNRVTIISTESQFTKVCYGTKVGYIKTGAIYSLNEATTDTKLNLYNSTASNKKKIKTVPSGAKVSIIEEKDSNWCRVSYKGDTGYVMTCFLTRNKKGNYTWKYENGYKWCYDATGKRITDVSDLVSGPYLIKTYKKQNIVVVYAKDGSKGYTIPVKAMICSCGGPTPTGIYYSPSQYRWLTMVGNSEAQWCTDIIGNYLFHTVPNLKRSNMTLNVDYFNLLGTTQSLGCVRLMCSDAKWIYDNTTTNQKIEITNSKTSPISQPASIELPSWHTWDPTDPTAHYKCTEKGCH